MSQCEQRCGREATVYAIDPHPNGWGGRYCEPCREALRFQVVDRLDKTGRIVGSEVGRP